MDHQYLNYNHNLIISPLKKLMNIEIYNDNYFSAKGQHAFTSNYLDTYSALTDTITSKPHKNTPAITPKAELFQKSGNIISTNESIEVTTLKNTLLAQSTSTILYTTHYSSSNVPQTVQCNSDGT